MLKCTSGGALLYEKVETLQIIILHIYIVICCYLCRWVTIGLQTFFPENFVYFWSLVCPWRLPGVIRGAGRDTDGKSRFKNTSTQNFEVLNWILTYICTLILWIICLNATSQLFNGFRFIALWVPWILRNRPISGGYALTKRALNLWPLS